MMKLVVAGLLIVVAIIAVGAFYFANQKGSEDGAAHSEIAAYFSARLGQKVIEKGGHPIEGVNAFILMNTFPKFVAADFEGVETFEGVYTSEGEELLYVRTADQPVTSAEQTISGKGYETLLSNVSGRLGLPTRDAGSVDEIVQALEGLLKDGSTSGVRGQVLLGPQCPVVREGDDSCNDKPYATQVQAYALGNSTNVVAATSTDESGNFLLYLDPGMYMVGAVGGRPLTDVTLSCDTGIR